MATTNAGLVGSQIINTLGNIANAQNSFSDSITMGGSDSWGSSGSQAYNNQDAWSLMKSISDANGESWENSGSTSRTYGREASAADIQRASEANQVQKDLWSMQADYNAKQAEIDREFQERMSNTAYQRAVVDLLKAGLNPILAVGNIGASTPVGAMASSGLASSHKATTFPESESSGWSNAGSYQKSHSESGSASKSTGRSASSSYSSEGSHSENATKSHSETNTQLNSVLKTIQDQIALANKAMNGGSAKDSATANKPRNGVTNWRNGQGYKK